VSNEFRFLIYFKNFFTVAGLLALFETRVPSFDTVLHNAHYTFYYRWNLVRTH